MTGNGRPIDVRRAQDADYDAVLDVLRTSLRWGPDDRYESLFRWKHRDSAFGPSAAWVALDGDRIVAYRALMWWEFARAGEPVRAVRAVDTATLPEYQGRGIFTALTLGALDELRQEDCEFVFNTPNRQSLPGYLKMGWEVVGRLPVAVRPTSPRGLVRMVSARAPAEQWSIEANAGVPVHDVLGERDPVAGVLASRAPALGLRTNATPEYLAWRYGPEFLGYRALVGVGGPASGFVIFRVRRRAAAREVAICELVAPDDDPATRRRLTTLVARQVDADYVILLGGPVISRNGAVRLPRQGPLLTWRGLRAVRRPSLRAWHVSLGDIERF